MYDDYNEVRNVSISILQRRENLDVLPILIPTLELDPELIFARLPAV